MTARHFTNASIELNRRRGKGSRESSQRVIRNVALDPRRIARITIRQGLDDGKPHTIFIDETKIGDLEEKGSANR